jgi:4a-hydroxytetrahydrobiopterin dehydratase
MWKETDGRLSRSFKFENFMQAFAFMTEVAFAAEKMDHHPDWSNSYNTVDIHLRTHSENAITSKDHTLAETIDKIGRHFGQ